MENHGVEISTHLSVDPNNAEKSVIMKMSPETAVYFGMALKERNKISTQWNMFFDDLADILTERGKSSQWHSTE